MKSDRTFSSAFLVSLIIHGVALWGIPEVTRNPKKSVYTTLQVQYYSIAPRTQRHFPSKVPPYQTPSTSKHKTAIPSHAQKTSTKQIQQERISVPEKGVQPVPIKKFEIATLDKDQLPEVEHEVIDLNDLASLKKESAFLDYYEAIRERIRRYAMLNYPSQFIEGEVCLSFTLHSSGRLIDVSIIDFKSSRYQGLRVAAVKSIREAAPFLPFPKNLNRKTISFTIIISFEIDSR